MHVRQLVFCCPSPRRSRPAQSLDYDDYDGDLLNVLDADTMAAVESASIAGPAIVVRSRTASAAAVMRRLLPRLSREGRHVVIQGPEEREEYFQALEHL